ncbi:MAG TPA: hypothetical protein VN931_03190 [Fibrobacteria bacterium]|nr:hypothetical protein [Fibrobacteria bacterium]
MMPVGPTIGGLEAFHASRDAAVRRQQPTVSGRAIGVLAGKSLTSTPRPVDAMVAAMAANGPLKGRHLDLVA